MGASVASDGAASRAPAAGPVVAQEAHEAQGQVRQNAQQAPREPERVEQKAREALQGKTREQVKRELAVARVSGCMDVADSQYPQPCPLPDVKRSEAAAFQVR
jgi:hypothetical protein